MTKTELLEDLSGRYTIKSVGTPELMELKPDGTKWYKVNVAEVLQKTAVFRNIDFYVFDEGTSSEEAYYKDSEPNYQVAPTTVRDFIKSALLNDPDIKTWKIREIDEIYGVGIIEALIEDPDDAAKLLPTMWLVGNSSGVFWKSQITVSPDVVAASSKA